MGDLVTLPGRLLEQILDRLRRHGKFVFVVLQPAREVDFDLVRPSRVGMKITPSERPSTTSPGITLATPIRTGVFTPASVIVGAHALTRAVGRGVRVNAIAPGWIDSVMMRKAVMNDPGRKAKIPGRTPRGGFGLPEDIGHAAVYLSSPAAKFLTGVCLPVDGGASIGFSGLLLDSRFAPQILKLDYGACRERTVDTERSDGRTEAVFQARRWRCIVEHGINKTRREDRVAIAVTT